jgi:hypothetical protein
MLNKLTMGAHVRRGVNVRFTIRDVALLCSVDLSPAHVLAACGCTMLYTEGLYANDENKAWDIREKKKAHQTLKIDQIVSTAVWLGSKYSCITSYLVTCIVSL